MATRMQQRRGTADQWITANPILSAGEIGFESDSGFFKIGDGVNQWADLAYFESADVLGASLGDYIELAEKGAVNGVAELDANGFVPSEQLNIDVTADINSAISALSLGKVLQVVQDTTNSYSGIAYGSDAVLGTIDVNRTSTTSKVLLTCSYQARVNLGPAMFGIDGGNTCSADLSVNYILDPATEVDGTPFVTQAQAVYEYDYGTNSHWSSSISSFTFLHDPQTTQSFVRYKFIFNNSTGYADFYPISIVAMEIE